MTTLRAVIFHTVAFLPINSAGFKCQSCHEFSITNKTIELPAKDYLRSPRLHFINLPPENSGCGESSEGIPQINCQSMCVHGWIGADTSKYAGPALGNEDIRSWGETKLLFRGCVDDMLPVINEKLSESGIPTQINMGDEMACIDLDAEGWSLAAGGKVCVCQTENCNKDPLKTEIKDVAESPTKQPQDQFSYYNCAGLKYNADGMDKNIKKGLDGMLEEVEKSLDTPMNEQCLTEPKNLKQSCSTIAWMAGISMDLENYNGEDITGDQMTFTKTFARNLGRVSAVHRGCLDNFEQFSPADMTSGLLEDVGCISVKAKAMGVTSQGKICGCNSEKCNGEGMDYLMMSRSGLSSFKGNYNYLNLATMIIVTIVMRH